MGRDAGKSRQITANVMDPEEVADFLRGHPDFLAQHPDILDGLTPPRIDHGSNVVDFQSFMVDRLRGDLRRVTDQQHELIAATRANLMNQNRIHAAALYLLDAQSLEHLIQTITTDLAVVLDLDVACLLVEASNQDYPRVLNSGIRVVEPGTIRRWLGRRDVILIDDTVGDPEIFGAAAGLVRSEALIRLQVSSAAPDGLLAFGSREPEMFQPGQGTELIGFLARVMERCIRSWLDLPPLEGSRSR